MSGVRPSPRPKHPTSRVSPQKPGAGSTLSLARTGIPVPGGDRAIGRKIFFRIARSSGNGGQGGALVAPAYPGRASRFEKPGPRPGLSWAGGGRRFLFLGGLLQVKCGGVRGSWSRGAVRDGASAGGFLGLGSTMTSPPRFLRSLCFAGYALASFVLVNSGWHAVRAGVPWMGGGCETVSQSTCDRVRAGHESTAYLEHLDGITLGLLPCIRPGSSR